MNITNEIIQLDEFYNIDAIEDVYKINLGNNVIDEGTAIDYGFFKKFVPDGLICMYSGEIENIPLGWVLCDGENGTPDLRDRFIVCEGNDYNVNDTGGEEKHILTVDEIPEHKHSVIFPSTYVSNVSFYSGAAYGAANYSDFSTTGLGNTQNAGSNEGHNNMPPYYALAFIMRKYI